MAATSLIGDSGFAGSSPHQSSDPNSAGNTNSDVQIDSPFDSLGIIESEAPHSAVERAMKRLQVKIAAFEIERKIVGNVCKEQWSLQSGNESQPSTWPIGLLSQRQRGLDEKLEACYNELHALRVAKNILIQQHNQSSESLLGTEPDSLTSNNNNNMANGSTQHTNNNNNSTRSGNVLDAAVLLHLERRAHRETKKQLRELKKRFEVVKDELDRIKNSNKFISEHLPPPHMNKDATKEICKLQAALLQLERVRDELLSQNKLLKSQITELSTNRNNFHCQDIMEDSESNRLRRKSTYKVVHGNHKMEVPEIISSDAENQLLLVKSKLDATEKKLQIKEMESNKELARMVAANARLQEDCNRERVARKRCHSQLQSLRGKVRVYCRVRPPSGRLPDDESLIAVSDTYTLSIFAKPGSPSSLRINPPPTAVTRDFQFDRVFNHTSSQDEIFQETSDLLESVMDGFNVCICAYGQTGTGKTHTILGSPEEPGLAPRVFTRLFELANEAETRCEVHVSAYVLELYNDKLIDLLKHPEHKDVIERLEIRRDRDGVVWVQGATVFNVSNADELQVLFQRALLARRTASTRLNATSSRSHLLIGVKIETKNRLNGSVLRGKISLLDLAGSERVSRSGAVDEQLKEASCINKSLAALGDVISALATDQPFVPYRNSKLTMLLQDSLGGNAKTLMFVTVSPDACDLDETVTSLTYATRVRQITNTAKRIAESREIARLKQIIEKLKRGERVDPDSCDSCKSDERSSS